MRRLLILLTVILAHAETNATFIKAGRLIDVRAGKVLTNQSILIEGDRIKQVGANFKPPDGARVIDRAERPSCPA